MILSFFVVPERIYTEQDLNLKLDCRCIWASLIFPLLGIFLWFLCRINNSVETMKVHPDPRKRNMYDFNTSLSDANLLMGRQKKLCRLPHIFTRVLELPFLSDIDVLIEENPDCFRFAVITDDVGDDVRAHAIEIYPGVTKIVIRGGDVLELSLDELEIDLWRFRLPPSTRPELTSAVCVDGELIVTVPKGFTSDSPGDGDLRDGMGHLLLVQ